MDGPDIIYPNFRRVQSGVSTTVFNLTPALRERGARVHLVGWGIPADLRASRLAQLGICFERPGRPVVWHARRNVEMLAGITLRRLGANIRLVFTSAGQRQHTDYTRWLMRQMDLLVYTSRRSASFVPYPGPVVGHGVEVPAQRDRRQLKLSLGLDPDTSYVASFGSIRHSKGTDLLVDALIGLLPSRPDWRALIVGPTEMRELPYRASLVGRVGDAGMADRIDFLGYVAQTGGYLQAVDICVAPSRSEGFGLTALEAMAAGTPVVTSRAGSYEETVVDGVTGLVTDVGSSDSLTQALAGLMDDPERRRQLGASARIHVQQNWSIAREADALLDVYRDLAAEAR